MTCYIWEMVEDTRIVPVKMNGKNGTKKIMFHLNVCNCSFFCLGLLKKVGGVMMWPAVGGTDQSGIFAPALCLSPW